MLDLLRIFITPLTVFTRIQQGKSGWVTPFLANMVLTLFFSLGVVHIVGYENVIRHMIETNPQLSGNVTQAQIEEFAEDSSKPVKQIESALLGLAITTFSLFALGLTLHLVLPVVEERPQFEKGRTPFRSSMAVVCYTWFAMSVANVIMAMLVIYFTPDRKLVDITRLSVLNPGYYMSAETNKFLLSAAESCDLFKIGCILLMALGLSKVAEGLPYLRALGIIAAIWIGGVVVWASAITVMNGAAG